MQLPHANTENIVVQNLKAEVLVYDLTKDKAYCLNETLGIIFNACDGITSFDELKKKHKFTDDLIHFAVAELRAHNLLIGEEQKYFGNLSRREIIKRVGLASMIALPAITGLVAPTAAQAASRCVNTTGPQRPANTFLGYRSVEFCANDAFTCCSNSTRYDTNNCVEINNVTHQIGCQCYCN